MKTLRIEDRDQRGILAFDLVDILAACEGYADRQWVAWKVEWGARYDLSDSDLEFFGSKCYEVFDTAPNKQVEMSFTQLLKCAKSVNQTEDGIFLAVRSTIEVVPQLYSLQTCEKSADLIIQAFD